MFERKIIDFYNLHGEYSRAKVISCVKDIGITIVKESDPNYYLLCLKMKLAPNFSHAKGAITSTRKDFTKIRKMIMSGTIDLSKLGIGYSTTRASSASCPFNQ